MNILPATDPNARLHLRSRPETGTGDCARDASAPGRDASPCPRPLRAALPLAVVGDSDSHSYQDRNHFAPGGHERGGARYRAHTLCWGEALARLRGDDVDLGVWGLHGNHWRVARVLEWARRPARSPFKEDYRYNFAMTGSQCGELLGGHHRQVSRLVSLMDGERAKWMRGVVVVRIGVNDFGTKEALDDFALNGARARTHAVAAACAQVIRASVERIRSRHPTTRIVLVGIPDNSHWARYLDRWCNRRQLSNIGAGLDRFDDALRSIADADPQIAFFDDRRWFAERWGGRDADGNPAYRAFALADDLEVTNTLGDAPMHASVRDGHAGLAWNAEWARALVALLNARFGSGLRPIESAEIADLVRRCLDHEATLPRGRRADCTGRIAPARLPEGHGDAGSGR